MVSSIGSDHEHLSFPHPPIVLLSGLLLADASGTYGYAAVSAYGQDTATGHTFTEWSLVRIDLASGQLVGAPLSLGTLDGAAAAPSLGMDATSGNLWVKMGTQLVTVAVRCGGFGVVVRGEEGGKEETGGHADMAACNWTESLRCACGQARTGTCTGLVGFPCGGRRERLE